MLRFLVMLVVGAASFCALGLAITAVIPNADASAAIVNATILPLLFLSGIFIPFGSNTPGWILWITRIFPVKHFADGMQAGFLGTPFHWSDVLVVDHLGTGGAAGGDAVLQLGAAPRLTSPAQRSARPGWGPGQRP